MRAPLVANPPISGDTVRQLIKVGAYLLIMSKLSLLNADYFLETYHIFDNFQTLVNFEFGVKLRNFRPDKFL